MGHEPKPDTGGSSRPRLVEMIAALEKQLLAKLEESRAAQTHAGDKGRVLERAVRETLRQYLPRRFDLGEGQVLDSHGGISSQTDIVIADEDHPFTFSGDSPAIYFVEGVAAAGEVKTRLTSTNVLSDISTKAIKFKALRPVIPTGFTTMLPRAQLKRFYERRPYFGFVTESDMSLDSIRDWLEAEQHRLELGHNEYLDALFALGRGAVINFGNGDEVMRFTPGGGQSVKGWAVVRTTSVLFALLSWLHVVHPNRSGWTSPLSPYFLGPSPPSPPEN